jgi:pimeloyl-ACP methyl ester carboxylesterase
MNTRCQEPENRRFGANRLSRTHGWIEAENNTQIYVRAQGEGPPILAIGGIGSGAFTNARIAKLLAKRHKLISYDRRGTFRSISDQPQKFDIAQQCRDVQRILVAHGLTSVTVLATCSSASIAMELLATYPDLVNAMVVHDPITVSALPNTEAEADKFIEYDRINLKRSADDAMATFVADFDLPYPDDLRRAMQREGRQLFRELRPCVTYQPDIKRLQQHRSRLVMATGQQCSDRGYSFARSAKALSEQIGCRFALVPGNHTGYFQEPNVFADAIFDLTE